MKLSELIKKYRLDHNLSLRAFAERTICSFQYINNIEKEEVKNPSIPTLKSIASAMGMSLDDLFRSTDDFTLNFSDAPDDDSKMYTAANISFIHIPLYSPICCGNGLFVDDQIEEMIAVPSDGLHLSPENYFAQRAKGDSMKDAGIADGDLLIFEKRSYPQPGMIGCFCIDENEAVCKKYKESSGIITLQAMNSDYEPIIINPENEHFSCIGKLKKVIKSFE